MCRSPAAHPLTGTGQALRGWEAPSEEHLLAVLQCPLPVPPASAQVLRAIYSSAPQPPRPSAMTARQEAALSRTQNPFSPKRSVHRTEAGPWVPDGSFLRQVCHSDSRGSGTPAPTHTLGCPGVLADGTCCRAEPCRVGQAGAPVQGTSFQKLQKTRYTRTSTYRVRTTLWNWNPKPLAWCPCHQVALGSHQVTLGFRLLLLRAHKDARSQPCPSSRPPCELSERREAQMVRKVPEGTRGTRTAAKTTALRCLLQASWSDTRVQDLTGDLRPGF